MEGGSMAEITAASIRDLRTSLGMTQEAFAQHLSVSVSSVRDWEQGRRRPRGLYAKLIAEQMAAQGMAKKAAA
jgi:DNA-binding transcriptional regulator YiaG